MAPLDGSGAGGFHQLFRQNVGLFCLGSGEFQLLHHPAGAVHQEAVRHQHHIVPRRQMHHPALPANAAEDAHRQAGFAHSPGLAPMHEKARGRTGLEEPGCAGIEVYAHEVEGRAALLVALERQRHVHEPGRKLCGKARFEQACRQLCGEVAPGAIIATLGCITPALFFVSLLSYIYRKYKDISLLQSVLACLRPVIVALIFGAGLSILSMVVFGESAKALANVDWIGIGSFASAFFVLRKLKWNPILTMCLCGVAGLGLHILLGI